MKNIKEILKIYLKLSDNEINVLFYIMNVNGLVTKNEVCDNIPLTPTTIQTIMIKLLKLNLISRKQKNQNTGYIYLYYSIDKKLLKTKLINIITESNFQVGRIIEEW